MLISLIYGLTGYGGNLAEEEEEDQRENEGGKLATNNDGGGGVFGDRIGCDSAADQLRQTSRPYTPRAQLRTLPRRNLPENAENAHPASYVSTIHHLVKRISYFF